MREPLGDWADKEIVFEEEDIIPVEDEIDIPSNAFIFFSKDNRANMASILGYYGEVEFKNNSVKKAELFAAACEMSESSK